MSPKREPRYTAHAAFKALRWSVNSLLRCFYKVNKYLIQQQPLCLNPEISLTMSKMET